jgi:hypothetical protein
MQPQPFPAKSGVSNRFVFGLSMLFALPFIAGGLLALVQGIRHYRTSADSIVPIIVGAVFTATGLLLVWGVRYAVSANAKREALQAQNPGKPWMWRQEWVDRIIKDSTKGRAIGIWIFALLWNAVSFPAALLIARPELAKGNQLALLVLLFPLVGIILLITAIYQTLRSMKFGTSTCHLEHVPIVPGRRFRGDIELSMDTAPENGYQVRVASVHAVSARTGRNRSTTEHLLWDAEIDVDAAAAMRSPMGVRVPFELATPADSHTTDESDSCDRYFWRLSASAQFPGVDYAAQFQLPVFQTGEEVDGSEFAAFQQRHRTEAARHQVPASSGVQITPQPGGGEEFRIQARKTIGATLRSLLFLAVWNAAIAAMIHFRTPWGFPAAFIAVDLLLIIGSIDYFLGQTTVTLGASGMSVRREWLGAGRTKSYDAATIASIDGATAGENSTSFGVTVKFSDGSTRVLAGYLPDRESADIVAAKMMADLRRA